MAECYLTFENLSGCVDLRERGQKDDNGMWNSDELVYRDLKDDVVFNVTFDEDKLSLSISAYHIENEETKRAFHTVLDSNLEWSDLKQLRDFFNLLLNWQNPTE